MTKNKTKKAEQKIKTVNIIHSISECKLMSGLDLRKRRSAPSIAPMSFGKRLFLWARCLINFMNILPHPQNM